MALSTLDATSDAQQPRPVYKPCIEEPKHLPWRFGASHKWGFCPSGIITSKFWEKMAWVYGVRDSEVPFLKSGRFDERQVVAESGEEKPVDEVPQLKCETEDRAEVCSLPLHRVHFTSPQKDDPESPAVSQTARCRGG